MEPKPKPKQEKVEIVVDANKDHRGYVAVTGKRDDRGKLVGKNGIRWSL